MYICTFIFIFMFIFIFIFISFAQSFMGGIVTLWSVQDVFETASGLIRVGLDFL